MNLPKTVRLTEKKLGREGAMGRVTHGKIPHIELDPRQSSQDRLDTLIHEAVHIIWPEYDEETVIKVANRISSLVWEDNWRRIQK